MLASYTLVTGPTTEPVTIDEAKRQARILTDDSDDLIDGYIRAAREAAEQYLGYGLLTQTWRLVLDGFYDEMPLPMALQLQNNALASPSTAVVVTYYDADGALQTLSSSYYLVDQNSRPGRVVRAPSMSWPATQADRLTGSVFITYVVGWSDADEVPQRIKQGMLSYITYLELDRDGTEPGALAARSASESCWLDTLEWVPPCR
jgi:uncharacterized phiE125 gp8 family phage protein